MTETKLTSRVTVIGAEPCLSLAEVARASSVHADYVVELVEEGIVEPEGQGPGQWRFSGRCLTRVRKAVRLQADLGLNMAGVGLALQLLEQMEDMQIRLNSLLDNGI